MFVFTFVCAYDISNDVYIHVFTCLFMHYIYIYIYSKYNNFFVESPVHISSNVPANTTCACVYKCVCVYTFIYLCRYQFIYIYITLEPSPGPQKLQINFQVPEFSFKF